VVGCIVVWWVHAVDEKRTRIKTTSQGGLGRGLCRLVIRVGAFGTGLGSTFLWHEVRFGEGDARLGEGTNVYVATLSQLIANICIAFEIKLNGEREMGGRTSKSN